ncbi:MAG TPA: ATP-dependent DNA helicase RecG [Steroidobacteraceae bacterium]|jgi:ATP-dependent DNA helicase RecG|nr:ATP-dependent DNA helicase RecG [Steroidobacteraceae bacterium]
MPPRTAGATGAAAARAPGNAAGAAALPGEVLFVLPLRYEDRTRVVPIGTLQPGERAVVEGEVLLAEIVFRRRRSLLVRLSDGTGSLTLRFFYFSNAQRDGLARGTRLRCHGEVRRGPLGLELVHPEYRRVAALGEPLPQTLTPIYPGSYGLTQGRWRALVDRALRVLDTDGVAELLPQSLLSRSGLPDLASALKLLHRPPVGTALSELAAGRHPAQRRLAFEELLAHHLALLQLRAGSRSERAAPLRDESGCQARLLASLPFALTGAQRRVLTEVERDLAGAVPMARLVQGDVGCGKTVIAAAAAARAIGSGRQAAFMAPTELLAEQHARVLSRWFEPLGIRVCLLTGSQPARTRRNALLAVASGSAQLCVGTHALFQQQVRFRNLALAIIDEQHRFGVQQRLALAAKGSAAEDVAGGSAGMGAAADEAAPLPHQLIMSATPIPRTLAMTVYADLDVSVIDELPPGRMPVRTVVVGADKRAQAVARIDEACRAGRQAYWVCPLIEESEELDCQAAEETATALSEALPALQVALLHGRMAPKLKEQVMQRFVAGEIQLLVATTVIEVGVDVPNADLMVIENAERMGLAQLHQLRGRVGRGAHEAGCVLLYRAPLSQMARSRLASIRETNDGFEIARRDLALRGPGELLGRRQTGLAQLRVADLGRDADLLDDVRATAAELLAAAPERVAALRERWIAEGEQYGRVG